jgi:hypothetical protein
MKSAIELVKAKRESHTKKGFNYDHDTQHTSMQFINAAKAYMYGDSYSWPFSDGFKCGDSIEDLVNAGSMIIAAIDRLQRYEVGKIYKVNCNHQKGTFKVLKVKMRKHGDVFVSFTGLSGDLFSDTQTFMLGSIFDNCTEPL